MLVDLAPRAMVGICTKRQLTVHTYVSLPRGLQVARGGAYRAHLNKLVLNICKLTNLGRHDGLSFWRTLNSGIRYSIQHLENDQSCKNNKLNENLGRQKRLLIVGTSTQKGQLVPTAGGWNWLRWLMMADHGKQIKEKKRSKLEEKDCLWPHGPSAIPDHFTGAVVHFCTFEARPPARAIPPPSLSSAPPVRDRPAQRTTTHPPLFLRTTHETALFI